MDKKIKKLVLVASCITALLVGNAAMCFADEATTPLYVNVSATAVDFEVTEKISMTGSGDSIDLTVDSLNVTNLSDVGVLNIDSIEVKDSYGWELISSEEDFAKLSADAKKFALIADGSHDMTSAYTGAGTVDPGATDTTTFSGKTGMVTNAVVNEKVADVVITVSYVAADETVYAYPTYVCPDDGEFHDNSLYSYGMTRTFEGASSVKVVFNKEMLIGGGSVVNEEDCLMVLDKDGNTTIADSITVSELIVEGDTATISLNAVNPGRNEDIAYRFDFHVTFIPLDENGNEIPLTDASRVYDEDGNLILFN